MDTGNVNYSNDPTGSTRGSGTTSGSNMAKVDTYNTGSTGNTGGTGNTGYTGSAYNYGSSASSQDQSLGDQVQQKAEDVVDQAKQTTGQVADQVQQKVTTQAESQKDKAADSLGSVAQALRQTGQQMRQDQGGSGATANIAQYADRAAEQVDRFSGYLRNHDVNQLVNEVEHFARRQPALFLGGALVLGLAAARFLKSSSQKAMEDQYQGYYSGRDYAGGAYSSGTGYSGYGARYAGGSGSSGSYGSSGSGGYTSSGYTVTGSGSTYSGQSRAYPGSGGVSNLSARNNPDSLAGAQAGQAGTGSGTTSSSAVGETEILEVLPEPEMTGYVPPEDRER